VVVVVGSVVVVVVVGRVVGVVEPPLPGVSWTASESTGTPFITTAICEAAPESFVPPPSSTVTVAGLPMAGSVGFGWWPPGGGFGVSGLADEVNQYRGVWLWRPSTDDLTAPVITASVAGTLGSNGWYVSDVSVTWAVQDPESEISSQVGCDPATITSDTSGTTLICEATSAGGTSTVPVVVKRDTTPPTVTCPSPVPVFQLYQVGALVTASVSDATSGAAAGPAQALANTATPGTYAAAVTGTDRAGNRATTVCAYQVVVPACGGLTPTIVGTASNDVIDGTSGRDVIVGLGGADTINGKGGDDVICGGDGPDTIDGGDGNDWIDGGASNDDLSGGNGDDTLGGGAGSDSLRGGNGTDSCTSGETRMSSCEL
jgi:Ca2+-binding RTX toxin-like protein